MRTIALAICIAFLVALGTGVVVAVSDDDGPVAPEFAQAATSRTCTKIGRLRWCFRTSAAEIATAIQPLADLTGYGEFNQTGPPPDITRIDVQTAVGRIHCDNAGDFFDCGP